MCIQTVIRFLEITSPVISAVGGAFLVYGAIKAPLTWWEHIKCSNSRKLERRLHKVNLLPLCSPPYPSEEAKNLITAEKERYEKNLEELDEMYSDKVLSELMKVQTLTIWGFFFLTIGYLLRLIVVCIH